MGCLALSYYEQAFPVKSGCFVFLSTAKAAQRCPQGNAKNCAGSYKFGFNGQEKVNEIAGVGNYLDFGARMYDSRIARWNAVDKVVKPYLSSYQFGRGNPIIFIDPDGNTEYYYNGKWVGSDGANNTLIGIVRDKSVKRNISKGRYPLPDAATLRNGSNTKDYFIIDANVLRASDAVLDRSLTKDGEKMEFGTRLNQNASGKYEMIPEGIVQGTRKDPSSKVATVDVPGSGGVEIHSHPTGHELLSNGAVKSHDATTPGSKDMEEILNQELVIIVGKQGPAESIETPLMIQGGKSTFTVPKRANGINIFDKNNQTKPTLSIPQGDAKQIIEDYGTRAK